MENKEEKFIEKWFVYLGFGVSTDNGKVAKICLVEGESLGQTFVYKFTKDFSKKVVGGVYVGAAFSDSQAKGLHAAKFMRNWPDQQARMLWQLEQSEAKCLLNELAFEKKNKNTKEIDRLIKPIKLFYSTLTPLGRETFESQIIKMLRRK